MTCDRYERDGRVLVEQGGSDPHLEQCVDCTRAHLETERIVTTLAQLGAGGDPRWQAEVWKRIAREERASSPRRGVRWPRLGIAVTVAAAVLAVVWWSRREPVVVIADRPRIEIVSGTVAMRSTSARVGDSVRVSVATLETVWIYRDERMIAKCPAACRRDDHGQIVELDLVSAGDYQIVVVAQTSPTPTGALDRDLAAVVDAGGRYRLTELVVR